MELTRAPVTQDGEGNPYPVIVRLTDPALFRCPFRHDERAGRLVSSATEEAANLRAYLLKGGFLWVDDFWGSRAWRNWENQIGKALSPAEYPIVDLTVDHTMFRMLFPVHTLPQIPNIGLWRMERRTSERGADSDELHVRGIQDRHGRVIVLMTHNTDFGDAYERESDDPSYFQNVLGQRLRDRHRRAAVRDDALIGSIVIGSHRLLLNRRLYFNRHLPLRDRIHRFQGEHRFAVLEQQRKRVAPVERVVVLGCRSGRSCVASLALDREIDTNAAVDDRRASHRRRLNGPEMPHGCDPSPGLTSITISDFG